MKNKKDTLLMGLLCIVISFVYFFMLYRRGEFEPRTIWINRCDGSGYMYSRTQVDRGDFVECPGVTKVPAIIVPRPTTTK